MVESGEVVFYGVFGIGFVLAGLTALFSGELKVIRRMGEPQRYLDGGKARWMSVAYILWGAVLCLLGWQTFQNQSPTLFETVLTTLDLTDDVGVAVLLGITFGLIGLPALLAGWSGDQG